VPNRTLQLLDDKLTKGQAGLTSREVRERLGLSPQAASNLLTRWRDAGLLDRVAPGHYAIRQLGLLGTRAVSEDIALAVGAFFADEPHRIAYRSALDYHGLLTRPARAIQVAERSVGTNSTQGICATGCGTFRSADNYARRPCTIPRHLRSS
jgi:predicted transcriptional regulator of viral defense system